MSILMPCVKQPNLPLQLLTRNLHCLCFAECYQIIRPAPSPPTKVLQLSLAKCCENCQPHRSTAIMPCQMLQTNAPSRALHPFPPKLCSKPSPNSKMLQNGLINTTVLFTDLEEQCPFFMSPVLEYPNFCSQKFSQMQFSKESRTRSAVNGY